jgi:hypothetical protein
MISSGRQIDVCALSGPGPVDALSSTVTTRQLKKDEQQLLLVLKQMKKSFFPKALRSL